MFVCEASTVSLYTHEVYHGFRCKTTSFLSKTAFIIDYAIERKRFNVRQSVRYVNKNIGLVTGIGTVFALALMIPALSLAACCFVSLLSVIAGTIAVERMNDKSVK